MSVVQADILSNHHQEETFPALRWEYIHGTTDNFESDLIKEESMSDFDDTPLATPYMLPSKLANGAAPLVCVIYYNVTIAY